MMILQLSIKGGKIVSGEEAFNKFIHHAIDGIYTLKTQYSGQPKTIQECRKYYFFLCEMIANEGMTGYKVKELHSLFKENVLKNMSNVFGNIANVGQFIDYNDPLHPTIIYSTKMLDLEGWYQYIDAVKLYVKEQMDFLI